MLFNYRSKHTLLTHLILIQRVSGKIFIFKCIVYTFFCCLCFAWVSAFSQFINISFTLLYLFFLLITITLPCTKWNGCAMWLLTFRRLTEFMWSHEDKICILPLDINIVYPKQCIHFNWLHLLPNKVQHLFSHYTLPFVTILILWS